VAPPLTRRQALRLGTAAGLTARAGLAAPSAAEQEGMARLAGEFLREHGLSGLSVAFAREGTILYAGGHGFADAAGQVRVTPDHRFRIASVSKPITGTAILACVQQGRLKLDAPVFGPRGLLDFPATEARHGITVDHLLTHTSGGWPNDGTDPMFREAGLNQAELIAWTLANRKPAHAPGEKYAYSNFGYCLLGRVLEKVTGQPYAEAVDRLVLVPCGITGMQLGGNTRADRRENEVEYITSRPEEAYRMKVTRMDAHGGWIATASDLVRFASQLPRLLNAETLRLLTTPGVNPGYARGWAVNRVPNWWHNGSLPGTTSILVHTAGGLCWAGLVNGRTDKSGEALDRLLWRMAKAVPAWRA
jgi:CubicO group peptidase (beta-lactamase class C family)